MPSSGQSEERILLARQAVENLDAFVDDVLDEDADLRTALKAIGTFAFSDSQRDPIIEVIQRNMEIEKILILVVNRDGKFGCEPAASPVADSGSGGGEAASRGTDKPAAA